VVEHSDTTGKGIPPPPHPGGVPATRHYGIHPCARQSSHAHRHWLGTISRSDGALTRGNYCLRAGCMRPKIFRAPPPASQNANRLRIPNPSGAAIQRQRRGIIVDHPNKLKKMEKIRILVGVKTDRATCNLIQEGKQQETARPCGHQPRWPQSLRRQKIQQRPREHKLEGFIWALGQRSVNFNIMRFKLVQAATKLNKGIP